MVQFLLSPKFFRYFTAIAALCSTLYMVFFQNLGIDYQSDFFLIVSFLILVFSGFFFLLIFLRFLEYFGRSKQKVVGLFIAIYVGMLVIAIDSFTNLFGAIRQYETNLFFRLKSGQLTVQEISEGAFLESVNKDAHPAIQIIGIDNNTVTELGGYPFSWQYYSDLLDALKGSELRAVLFDIFFLDKKKDDFGLEQFIEGIKKQTENLEPGKSISITNELLLEKSQKFSSKIKEFPNIIVDYSFESELVLGQEITELRKKEEFQALKKFAIPEENVLPSEYNRLPDFYRYPQPPLYDVLKSVESAGAANIPYSGEKANHWMPLVIQWDGRLYPTFSLLAACSHLRVNCPKDLEVKLGSSIRINNIPDLEVPIGVTGDVVPMFASDNKKDFIEIPINEQGMMRINFIGGAFSFPRISMAQILNDEKDFPGSYGKDNPLFFRNKLLLVAMFYATGVASDVHPSPFGNIAGIEHHANAINTILMQDFIKETPRALEYLLCFIVAVVFGILGPRLRIIQVFVISFTFAILLFVEAVSVFSLFNISHTALIPIIESFAILLAIISYRVLAEEENVKYVRSTFSKFVSKEVVNELLSDPESIQLGGAGYEMTVFFSDIRGFTEISEKLAPEQLVHILNEYLASMTEAIIQNRGAIDKYIGDAIMAFWGAPIPEKNHALNACRASLLQIERLKKLQQKWVREGQPMLDIGIGLNTGPAVAGNIGSEHRMDFTIIGDMVNLGSRLEGTNKVYGTRIIISEFTYEHVKNHVYVRELDLIKVKGKNEPVRIYELLAMQEHQ